MLFPTDNNTEIGWIWDPFTANISEECGLVIKERNLRKKKSKLALNLMFAMALGF
jgi:hypothetical protein